MKKVDKNSIYYNPLGITEEKLLAGLIAAQKADKEQRTLYDTCNHSEIGEIEIINENHEFVKIPLHITWNYARTTNDYRIAHILPDRSGADCIYCGYGERQLLIKI